MQTLPTADLQIYLTLEQSGLVLEALMEQPFKKVFEVIGSLNQQAQQFYQPDADKHRAQLFTLTKTDFSVCIKALGELPYNRVSGLIESLHQQLHSQLFVPTDSAAQTNTEDTNARRETVS
ncbi:hypothetical protein D0C16_17365 [Cellvibrio sp. KY-GH-1]|uniref:hypothetical protein n=1 Tax=Cellvibrio sp. KY-GH-1 TaxID=2303332 RepID=UPI001246E50F|nr:hypothetical protein [Cellvibrio sp. KY-GH-1]QEY17600.1 hypothetical protein D0C16_17365 [Cellvibrio sp. KY-GH-1]